MPDRFDPMAAGVDRFDVPGRSVRPVWISIDIRQGTEAGNGAWQGLRFETEEK